MSGSDIRLDLDEISCESNVKKTRERKIVAINQTLPANGKKTTEHVQELLRLWKRYTKHLPLNDPTLRNIAAELCALLLKTKSLGALAVFLEALPDIQDYSSNESIVRAKIHVAITKKDTRTIYKLIQGNEFSNSTEDLIKIWDEALYIDEEKRTGKKLTPLSRFRIRKRFAPPASICKNGIRKTNALPREATSFLKSWLLNHVNDPYPSSLEKQHLAKTSGLSQAQVKTWFANARRRNKSTEEFQRRCEENWSTTVSECSKSSSSPPPPPLYLPHHNNLLHHHENCYGGGENTGVTENNNVHIPAHQDYTFQHLANHADRDGLNRCEIYPQKQTSTTNTCNTGFRVYRTLEDCHLQYDAAHVLIDISAKQGYHCDYLYYHN